MSSVSSELSTFFSLSSAAAAVCLFIISLVESGAAAAAPAASAPAAAGTPFTSTPGAPRFLVLVEGLSDSETEVRLDTDRLEACLLPS